MHKKGADGEKTKARKTRKATGKARGVFGASFDDIKKKRDQSAAARATARAKALRCDTERPCSHCRGRLLECLPRAPLTPPPPVPFSDAKTKKAEKSKSSKGRSQHQGGGKQAYARPDKKGGMGRQKSGRKG